MQEQEVMLKSCFSFCLSLKNQRVPADMIFLRTSERNGKHLLVIHPDLHNRLAGRGNDLFKKALRCRD